MPGVIVRTATRSGPVNPLVPEAGRYFVTGLTTRGRTDKAVRVRSLAEFEVSFGGRPAFGFLYDDLRTFFEEGGTEAHVARVVGPAATVGTISLPDSVGPATSVILTALGAGAWSSGLTVTVANATVGGTAARKLTLELGGIRESYDELDTNDAIVEALKRSNLARASVGTTALAGSAALPPVTAATAFSAGSDDRAAVTASHITAALDLFGTDLGAGIVATPGYPSSSTAAALKAHAKATRRLFLTHVNAGASVTDAVNAAATLLAPDGEYGGLVYPHVRIPLGSSTKLVPPTGYAAAMRARAHRDVGPWAAPAGARAVASFVLEPEVPITRTDGDRLDEGHVSAIRTIAGSTRLYGWRSLSTDLANYSLLIGRDVLNVLAYEGERRLEPYVFRTIDGKGQLLAEVAGELVGLVDPFRARGGLFARTAEDGTELDPGYSVDVGPTVNTDAVLANNTVAAVLAVRVSPVGALIDLTIVKAGLTATV